MIPTYPFYPAHPFPPRARGAFLSLSKKMCIRVGVGGRVASLVDSRLGGHLKALLDFFAAIWHIWRGKYAHSRKMGK